MNRFIFRSVAAAIALACGTAALSASAQLPIDSPVGVSAALIKLFGNITAFTAKADVRVFGATRKETLRTPMDVSLLDGKMRMDVDMNQTRGTNVAQEVAQLKKVGLDRVSSVIRLDQKLIYLVFPDCRSYVSLELSAADAEAAEKGLQVLRKPLGTETVDDHVCAKNQVTVKNSRGSILLNATTWNATDLKDFPVQITLPANNGTTVMHFKPIQLNRPAAGQFEPPKGFAHYHSAEALMLAIASKPKTAAPRK